MFRTSVNVITGELSVISYTPEEEAEVLQRRAEARANPPIYPLELNEILDVLSAFNPALKTAIQNKFNNKQARLFQENEEEQARSVDPL